jgi:hypothetical protein
MLMRMRETVASSLPANKMAALRVGQRCLLVNSSRVAHSRYPMTPSACGEGKDLMPGMLRLLIRETTGRGLSSQRLPASA